MAESSHFAREVRRFQRASRQRLEEAAFLFAHEFTTAAVYMGGYAVECALKALILANEPTSRHTATINTFRGAKAHEYEWLRKELQRRKVYLPTKANYPLNRVGMWTVELRYSPFTVDKADAAAFLAATQELIQWVEGKI